jgi:hypothetical protein
MDFIVMKTTVLELILPENHTRSEKLILWSKASNYSTRSTKIGLIQKYFTE